MSSPDTQTSTPRKGSPKKVAGCSERLAGLRPKTPPELPALVTPKQLSKEDLDRHIHTIYTTSVEKKKRTMAANEAVIRNREEQLLQYGGNKAHRTASDVHEIVQRLSEEQVRVKVQKEHELLHKYEATYREHNKTHINSPSGKDKLSSQEAKVWVDRLYVKGMESTKKHMHELVHEYCPPKTSPRRTREQIAAAATRLWRNEK